MNANPEVRLKLLDKYYGLVKAATLVDASCDDVKTIFRERRKMIQDRIDTIGRHLEGPNAPELFNIEETMPEVDMLIADPLADLPRL